MEFLNIPLIDEFDLAKLIVKFGLNLLVVFIVVRLLYYPNSKQKDYLFTYFLFNTITFFICFMLRKVPMEMGFALGLFAVFGVLRYRTEAIAIKEMTYLFIVIGLAMLNALSNKSISWAEILFANIAIVVLAWGIEVLWFKNQLQVLELTYDKLENLKLENKHLLLEDISERTGLQVTEVRVKNFDLLKDTAAVTVYYKA